MTEFFQKLSALEALQSDLKLRALDLDKRLNQIQSDQTNVASVPNDATKKEKISQKNIKIEQTPAESKKTNIKQNDSKSKEKATEAKKFKSNESKLESKEKEKAPSIKTAEQKCESVEKEKENVQASKTYGL